MRAGSRPRGQCALSLVELDARQVVCRRRLGSEDSRTDDHREAYVLDAACREGVRHRAVVREAITSDELPTEAPDVAGRGFALHVHGGDPDRVQPSPEVADGGGVGDQLVIGIQRARRDPEDDLFLVQRLNGAMTGVERLGTERAVGRVGAETVYGLCDRGREPFAGRPWRGPRHRPGRRLGDGSVDSRHGAQFRAHDGLGASHGIGVFMAERETARLALVSPRFSPFRSPVPASPPNPVVDTRNWAGYK